MATLRIRSKVTRKLYDEIDELLIKYCAYKESPSETKRLEVIGIAARLVLNMKSPNFDAQAAYIVYGEAIHRPEEILNELSEKYLKLANTDEKVTTPFSENPAQNVIPPGCYPEGICSHSQPVASAAASNSYSTASDSQAAPPSPKPPGGPSLSGRSSTSIAAVTDAKGTAIVSSPATANSAGPALSPAAFFSHERHPTTAAATAASSKMPAKK